MKVVFMGTPDFAVSILSAIEQAGHELVLVVSQPDKPKGRSGQLAAPPTKEWAIQRNIPVFQPTKIRDAKAVEFMSKIEADIFVVAAFGQILPKAILDMPRLGCVNVHASLLPKYRGAAPIQWAVLNGDEISGVTTMLMGVGLDDGDILQKAELALASDETGGSLFDKLAILGGELIVETMAGLEAGTITPIPQDEASATHVGMIKKSLGQLDFSRPAIELERYVRGLNPWPSAFTTLDGKTLKIWKASTLPASPTTPHPEQSESAPGTILSVGPAGISVATSNGTFIIEELQLEGKKRMSVADFLRGREVPVGTILGVH